MALVDIRQGYKDAAWFAANPTLVLKEGQQVHYLQTGTYKIGDGVTQLSALTFLGGSSTYTAGTGLQLVGTQFSFASTNISQFTNDSVYITPSSTNTLTNKSGNISQWTNDSSYLTTATASSTYQPILVSGTNIKTVNGSTLLGSGNLAVGDALVANPLSQFASTTSAQLSGVISDETGTGVLVFATSPTLSNITLSAGTNALPQIHFNVTSGVAPTTPVSGDLYFDNTGDGLTLYNSNNAINTFTWSNGTIKGNLALVTGAGVFVGSTTNDNLTLVTNNGVGAGYGAMLHTNGGFKINPTPSVTPTSVLTVQASALSYILDLKTTSETVSLFRVSSAGVVNIGSGTASSFMYLDSSKNVTYKSGTSSQFMKADGSFDSSTYLTSATGVTSVSGTTNRITSTGGATPVIDISASYVGQSTITTLGTVTTGTWNATILTPQYGGTGTNNATNTSGSFLRSNGTNGNYVASTLILPNAATAQQIVFATSTNNYGASANFTFTPSAQRSLYILGSSGSGFYLGSYDGNWSGFWGAGITPASTNYSLITNGASVALNITSGGLIQFNVSDVLKANMNSSGRFFFGGATSATALVHLAAGTKTASTAPLKFTAGTNLTTPENGAMEFDGTHLYITIAGVRTTIV